MAIVRNLQLYSEGILRQEGLNELRPFDEAAPAAIEVFLNADIQRLLQVVQPVQIHMVKGGAIGGSVFIDEGKGRAAHGLRSAQLLAKGFDQGGFAGPDLSGEGPDRAAAGSLQQGLGGLADILEMVMKAVVHRGSD